MPAGGGIGFFARVQENGAPVLLSTYLKVVGGRITEMESQVARLSDTTGSGTPANLREDVFKPFLRLDDARNQDEGGTGLGRAIARDIARSHGGDITLGDSPMGGLRATVRIPV